MSLVTILLFFVYTIGLGFTATHLIKVKESDEFVERWLMRIGIGLGVFVLLGIILNIFHIPLHWWIFLLLSVAYPLFSLIKIRTKQPYKLTKGTVYSLVMLFLFVFSLVMYAGGAYQYPYLEDDDPWSHALGVSYIAKEKTLYEPIDGRVFFQYVDPYPPGYELVMGVLHQTSGDMIFTLKFFNALIISLGTIFFFFFFKEIYGKFKKSFICNFLSCNGSCFLKPFYLGDKLSCCNVFCCFLCDREDRRR